MVNGAKFNTCSCLFNHLSLSDLFVVDNLKIKSIAYIIRYRKRQSTFTDLKIVLCSYTIVKVQIYFLG